MNAYDENRAQIDVEASEWLARLAGSNANETADAQLAEWLKRSPEHVRAFLEASDAFYRLDGLTPSMADEIRRTASGPRQMDVPAAGRVPRLLRPGLRWTLAAALALVAIGGWLSWMRVHAMQFATDVGEQRVVKLADGSTVHLNTRSKISVKLSDTEREVTLDDGEALFTVERDAQRPFTVHSGNLTVRALGRWQWWKVRCRFRHRQHKQHHRRFLRQ
jgi:transmembrane sensor